MQAREAKKNVRTQKKLETRIATESQSEKREQIEDILIENRKRNVSGNES